MNTTDCRVTDIHRSPSRGIVGTIVDRGGKTLLGARIDDLLTESIRRRYHISNIQEVCDRLSYLGYSLADNFPDLVLS